MAESCGKLLLGFSKSSFRFRSYLKGKPLSEYLRRWLPHLNLQNCSDWYSIASRGAANYETASSYRVVAFADLARLLSAVNIVCWLVSRPRQVSHSCTLLLIYVCWCFYECFNSFWTLVACKLASLLETNNVVAQDGVISLVERCYLISFLIYNSKSKLNGVLFKSGFFASAVSGAQNQEYSKVSESFVWN